MFPYAEEVNPAGWFHLAYFGVLLPVVAVLQRKKALGTEGALPDRLRHFQRTAAMLVMLTVISLMVARVQWITLFPWAAPPILAVVAGVAVYAAAVAYIWPRWRRAVERRARVVHLFMPANALE